MVVTKQTMLSVSSLPDSSGRWRVHVRKGPGLAFGQHPELLPSEAESLAIEIGNAAAECRRKNIRKAL
jgi:hypothetical protein